MPPYAVIDGTFIPLEEIKYAKDQRRPGTPDANDEPEMLVVFFKTGGHVCFEGHTVAGLVDAIVDHAKLQLPK